MVNQCRLVRLCETLINRRRGCKPPSGLAQPRQRLQTLTAVYVGLSSNGASYLWNGLPNCN